MTTERTVEQIRDELAARTEECVGCSGFGEIRHAGSAEAVLISRDPGEDYSQCTQCGGAGRVFVLDDSVREPCPDPECIRNKGYVAWTGAPYAPSGDTQLVKHPECASKGWVASRDPLTWIRSLDQAQQLDRVFLTSLFWTLIDDGDEAFYRVLEKALLKGDESDAEL